MPAGIVTAPRGRAKVSVSQAGRPVVTAITVPGEQGPPGISTGFGQVTYTERELEPSDYFTPGVRAQVIFSPTSVSDKLNEPFKGHQFWQNNRVRPRAVDDLYDFQVNLIVVSTVAGGMVRLDADTGSTLGPIASDTQTLFNGALDPERVTFRLRAQVLETFRANGCAFFLTSTVPLTTVSETVLINAVTIQP